MDCSNLLNATDTGRAVAIRPARPMVMDFLWTYTAPNGRKCKIKTHTHTNRKVPLKQLSKKALKKQIKI